MSTVFTSGPESRTTPSKGKLFMTVCRMHLSPYQRRSKRTIEIMMGICIAAGILCQAILERHNPPTAIRYGLALVTIAPILATMYLIAKYLRGEKDEYLRGLVIESMLCGLGAVLVADTFFSFVAPITMPTPIGILSLDLFVLVASGTLERKLWSNQ
jgi:hypothetical protein